MTLRSPHQLNSGFSLIEVTLSLGIIAFALVAVIGLLPAGLNSQKEAADQSHGVQVLNDLTQAVRGIYNENGTLRFAPPLRKIKDPDGGEQDIIVAPGTEASFALMENGTLAPLGNNSLERRGTVYVNQRPVSANAPRAVFISVAWPQTAARVSGAWTKASSSTSVYVYPSK